MKDYRKKILLLGGEGFIGRNISDVACKTFDCYVCGPRRSPFSNGNAKFIQKDPYTERIDQKFDVVINLIDNQVPYERVTEEENKLLENILGTGCRQLIFFSSASVYAAPDSEYAKRKILIEKTYEEFSIRYKMKLLILRLFNIYGPYQLPFKKGSLVANIFYNHLLDKPIEINDMHAKRDFIYAPDIAQIISRVIDQEIVGTHDLASNKLITLCELLESIKKVFQLSNLNIINKKVKDDSFCPEANSDLVENKDLTPLTKGLEKTLPFYKKNLRLIEEIVQCKQKKF